MNDPLTKPSRTNRKMKRRWKRQKSINLIQQGLTDCYRVANLCLLSQKTKVWSRNQSNGHKWPLLNVVFLCPPKTQAAYCRLFIMAGLFGQRLALAGTVTGFLPHLNPPPDTVESIDGGYSLFNGATA
ncbi:MAG: hypothetical protein Q7U66_06215 [Methylobacter sp.]|nr:hypothetical protein [Methylobacter sp.]